MNIFRKIGTLFTNIKSKTSNADDEEDECLCEFLYPKDEE